MKSQIVAKTSRFFNNAGLQIKKHSPEILLVAGIAGTVTSTVLACKATTKATGLIEDAKKEINAIHAVAERDDKYSKKDLQQALTISYTQTGLKLLKLYAPAITLGALSITSIVAGHNILKKRTVALAAAYAVVDKGFKDYRKNVVSRFGEEIDKELRYNIKAKEIEVETVDEKGKKKTKKEIVNILPENDLSGYSEYARFFDASSGNFEKDPEYNLMFLRRQQDYANELLRSRGHLFLNEVYDMLDIQRTKAGQVVGWVYDEKNPIGDNCVDFGIYNTNSEAARRFVNGLEYNILLDFNVDGVIYDLI